LIHLEPHGQKCHYKALESGSGSSIKSVMGFRQFLLRGLKKVTGEWTLACLAWNLKRMAVLRQKSVQWA
jgi:hypothetical protein